MKNPGLRIWSLLLASMLALFVYGQSNSAIRTIVLPVEHKNLPDQSIILRPKERNIQVTLRGPSHVLAQLTQTPPSAVVRFPSDVGKSYRMIFQRSDLPIPGSVEVLSVEPPEIDYVLDTIVSRELAVVIPSFGKPAKKLELKNLTAEPGQVLVRGPETILATRNEIETEPLDLRQITESGTREIPLVSGGDLLTYSQHVVNARFEVEIHEAARTFERLPIEIRSTLDAEVMLTPQFVSVQLSGEAEAMEKITPAQIIPFIRLRNSDNDMKNKFESGIDIEVELDLPSPLVRATSIQPAKVFIKKRER
jgi:YbbR domain-containing protein